MLKTLVYNIVYAELQNLESKRQLAGDIHKIAQAMANKIADDLSKRNDNQVSMWLEEHRNESGLNAIGRHMA